MDRGITLAGQYQNRVVKFGDAKRRHHCFDVLVAAADADPEEIFATAQRMPVEYRRISRDCRDVVTALVADRHCGRIGAVPFADLPAREFRHSNDAGGTLAYAGDDESIGGAKAP